MEKYISVEEASQKTGYTPRRIQQLCRNGDIQGAVKNNGKWQIPANAVLLQFGEQILEKIKPLPIGISDYIKASTEYYYVDKTLFIKDFIDSKPSVSLFTRPRRFGKTLNMDMLRVFFEKTNSDTSIYFRDKLIWQYGNEYTKYQGQFPVIFLTFKDVKCQSWEDTFEKIRKLISIEFLRHYELESSPKLNPYEIEEYKRLASGDANEIDFQMSLQLLSLLLHKHHEKEAIIIIDEYDTPIQQGHVSGFYDDIIGFMRNFFSGGLKDNPHLSYGFLTGILRVAKESIFSGLNNLKINSILDKSYSQYFGFTKDEVEDLLSYYGADEKYDEISSWYDGYRFGDNDIFNPWSVINYVSDDFSPKAFWQSTGSNDIIGEILSNATSEINENLHKLLCGESITTYIDTSVIYPEVQKRPYSIYSFLLVAGYLKVSNIYPQHDGNFMCNVAIPNKEISFVYEKEILENTHNEGIAISIKQAIFSVDEIKLQALLEQLLLESASAFDVANESFYHGMMLGLCAVLNNHFQIRSNLESGLGRFDIQLTPHNKSLPAFIFEFKYTKNENDNLEALAQKAITQIKEKKYDTQLRTNGINNIIGIGIAFRGKSVKSLKEIL